MVRPRARAAARAAAAVAMLSALSGAAAADDTGTGLAQPCHGPVVGVVVPLCMQLGAHGLNGPWIPAGRRLTYASGRPQAGEVRALDRFGLSVAEITGALARRYRITQSVDGVVVVAIVPAGPLAGSGLAVGDVIVEIDQEPVAGPDDLSERLAAVERSAGRSALLLLYRDYEHLFQTLALD